MPVQLLRRHSLAANFSRPAAACRFGHPEAFTHSIFDMKAVLADAMPTMGHLQPPFPHLSCCNRQGFTSTNLIPSDLEPAQSSEQPLRAGANDTRDPRAIFLGSPTGELAPGFSTGL